MEFSPLHRLGLKVSWTLTTNLLIASLLCHCLMPWNTSPLFRMVYLVCLFYFCYLEMSDESTKNPHKTEEELVNRENHDNIEIEKKDGRKTPGSCNSNSRVWRSNQKMFDVSRSTISLNSSIVELITKHPKMKYNFFYVFWRNIWKLLKNATEFK